MAVISQIDLFVDSTKAQAVSNDKGVHIIILWQVVIGFLEVLYLLGIEDMDLPVKRSQRGIFPQEKYEIVSIDRCSFKTYDDCIEGTGSDCGKNPFYHLG